MRPHTPSTNQLRAALEAPPAPSCTEAETDAVRRRLEVVGQPRHAEDQSAVIQARREVGTPEVNAQVQLPFHEKGVTDPKRAMQECRDKIVQSRLLHQASLLSSRQAQQRHSPASRNHRTTLPLQPRHPSLYVQENYPRTVISYSNPSGPDSQTARCTQRDTRRTIAARNNAGHD